MPRWVAERAFKAKDAHIGRKLHASAAAAEMLLTTKDTKDHERDQTRSVPPSSREPALSEVEVCRS